MYVTTRFLHNPLFIIDKHDLAIVRSFYTLCTKNA